MVVLDGRRVLDEFGPLQAARGRPAANLIRGPRRVGALDPCYCRVRGRRPPTGRATCGAASARSRWMTSRAEMLLA